MKKLQVFILLAFCFSIASVAQVPRFAKYPIMETGANIYIPAEPTWEKSGSEDGSDVYTTEVTFANVNYGAIVVKFAENIGTNKTDWDNLLTNYVEFLSKDVFGFTNSELPGRGHTLDSNPDAIGMITYGIDKNGVEFAVKAWIDSRMLAVLYVSSGSEVNYNVQQLFLNGFRFPEK